LAPPPPPLSRVRPPATTSGEHTCFPYEPWRVSRAPSTCRISSGFRVGELFSFVGKGGPQRTNTRPRTSPDRLCCVSRRIKMGGGRGNKTRNSKLTITASHRPLVFRRFPNNRSSNLFGNTLFTNDYFSSVSVRIIVVRLSRTSQKLSNSI